jgi:hypothetical protein
VAVAEHALLLSCGFRKPASAGPAVELEFAETTNASGHRPSLR